MSEGPASFFQQYPWVAPVLFVAIFVAFLWLIRYFVAKSWRNVASIYGSGDLYRGPTQRARYVKLAGSEFESILKAGADEIGLYLRLSRLFGAKNPSLYIPWDRVSSVSHQSTLIASSSSNQRNSRRIGCVALDVESLDEPLLIDGGTYGRITAGIARAPREEAPV